MSATEFKAWEAQWSKTNEGKSTPDPGVDPKFANSPGQHSSGGMAGMFTKTLVQAKGGTLPPKNLLKKPAKGDAMASLMTTPLSDAKKKAGMPEHRASVSRKQFKNWESEWAKENQLKGGDTDPPPVDKKYANGKGDHIKGGVGALLIMPVSDAKKDSGYVLPLKGPSMHQKFLEWEREWSKYDGLTKANLTTTNTVDPKYANSASSSTSKNAVGGLLTVPLSVAKKRGGLKGVGKDTEKSYTSFKAWEKEWTKYDGLKKESVEEQTKIDPKYANSPKSAATPKSGVESLFTKTLAQAKGLKVNTGINPAFSPAPASSELVKKSITQDAKAAVAAKKYALADRVSAAARKTAVASDAAATAAAKAAQMERAASLAAHQAATAAAARDDAKQKFVQRKAALDDMKGAVDGAKPLARLMKMPLKAAMSLQAHDAPKATANVPGPFRL